MFPRHPTVVAGALFLCVMIGAARAQDDMAATTNVTVTLTPYHPPITIAGGGGSFGFNLAIGNGEPHPQSLAVWTTYTLPDGGEEVAGYGPVDLQLPGDWTAQVDRIQSIPGEMPDGHYSYTAHAGVYPGEVWASDTFEFEKLPQTVGWYSQSPGAENGLSGVSFVDQNTGWAVSTYREILHTTNGGDVWQPQDDGQYYPQEYNDVQFIDGQTGWVVGSTILHTVNAGATWVEQTSDNGYNLNSVHFVDANHGWAAGGFYDLFGTNNIQVIEHTSDGGETWDGQFWQSYHYPFQSVFFADADHGWAVGGPGGIVSTTNGGSNWNEQDAETASYLQDVYFLDRNTGWCVGNGGTVRRTVDGGAHWQAQVTGVPAEFKSVYFVDATTGWIAGVDNNALLPVILHTQDGGETWIPQATETGSNYIVLRDICFVDADHGWISGSLWPDVGVMLHTETGGGTAVAGVHEPGGRDGTPARALVSDPYPNPFNPRTSLRFTVPGTTQQFVTITIFDLQGRRIRSLIAGLQAPGEHVVAWDGLTDNREQATSGVYLYRATIGEVKTSGKVTLLK